MEPNEQPTVPETNDKYICRELVVREGLHQPCGFMANGKSGLAIHKRFTHGIPGENAIIRNKTEKKRKANAANMRQCPYCDFETYDSSSYTRHQKQKHPGETGFARIGSAKPTKVAAPSGALFDKVAELVAEKIFNKLMS